MNWTQSGQRENSGLTPAVEGEKEKKKIKKK
jgi:hypothetical protein